MDTSMYNHMCVYTLRQKIPMRMKINSTISKYVHLRYTHLYTYLYCGVVANALVYDIIVSEFKPQPCNYVHSRDPIYPTPLLGQDMTQSQFLSGV